MPAALALYITKYGYIAIFLLVFLQELGLPNPVPTELIILFGGYLSFAGVLSFPLVFLSAVAGDFIGTTILYLVFYLFGEYILSHKPKWLPISREKINKLGERISKKGRWGIYVGRLIPYLRGYASVAAGLLEIKPKVFIPAVIVPAVIWSGGYSILGRLLGRYWLGAAQTIVTVEKGIVLVIAVLLVYFLGHFWFRLRKSRKENQYYENR